MIKKIAYYLGRKDEQANIDLAIEIISRAGEGIPEIVNGLGNSKNRIAHDCIKVLYEIGKRKPEMIAEYAEDFIKLLRSGDNRMVWGSMTALAEIVYLRADYLYDNLGAITQAYENGSVITVDASISVFAGLAKASHRYATITFPFIINHLKRCRPKEVAQHAERAFICVTKHNAAVFGQTLEDRRDSLSEPQKQRIDKLLKKLDQDQFGV